jgi:hypothetical protein
VSDGIQIVFIGVAYELCENCGALKFKTEIARNLYKSFPHFPVPK